jgi:AcrR family transcriptional regulator
MSSGRRGAVRSEVARAAILAAASSLMERFGYDRVTIEGIASEAGVGKQTIYRWWPSKSAVVAECLVEGALLPETFAPRDSGDIRADLSEWLRGVFAFLSAPAHNSMVHSLIGAAVENADVGERLRERLGASPHVLVDRLQAALDAGQLRPGVSPQLISDALVGAIIARVLLRSSLPAADAQALVELILDGTAA